MADTITLSRDGHSVEVRVGQTVVMTDGTHWQVLKVDDNGSLLLSRNGEADSFWYGWTGESLGHDPHEFFPAIDLPATAAALAARQPAAPPCARLSAAAREGEVTVPIRRRGAYSFEWPGSPCISMTVKMASGFRRAECRMIAEMFEDIAYRLALPDEMHPNDIGELTDAQKIARQFEEPPRTPGPRAADGEGG